MPGIKKILAEAKTLVAASPRIGEVDSKPAQEVAAEAALEEEGDEEEEENPNVHFKQKFLQALPLGRRRKLTGHLVRVIELCRLRR